MAGPVTNVACRTVERSASARVNSSSGTRVGHIERIAGFPSAAEQPLANESARNGQSELAPERLTASSPAVIAASIASETDEDELAREPVGDRAGGQGEEEQRQELGQADEAEMERVPRDLVDLPADRDEHHLAGQPVRDARAEQRRVVALAQNRWQPPSHRRLT